MDPRVAAAIVAALSALAVSIVTAIATRRQGATLERLRQSLALDDEETKAALSYLKIANGFIQEFRDVLQTLDAADATMLSNSGAKSLVGDVASRYLRSYQENVGALDRDVRSIAHAAKNVIHDCQIWLVPRFSDKSDFSLEAADRRRLTATRRKLADLQHQLTECRVELLQRKLTALRE